MSNSIKTALITGASSGAGPGIAKVLNRNGYYVILASRQEIPLKETLSDLDNNAHYHLFDVRHKKSVAEMVDAALEKIDQIDILVNNMGIMPLSRFAEREVEDWDRMIDVNLRGMLYTIDAVLPGMMKRKTGHIVNISSVAAHSVHPSTAVYSATKAGVKALSEGLRKEMSDENIRVTTIYPGGIDSDPPRSVSDEILIAGMKGRYSADLLEPEVIGEAVLYALMQPENVCVSDIVIRPTRQKI